MKRQGGAPAMESPCERCLVPTMATQLSPYTVAERLLYLCPVCVRDQIYGTHSTTLRNEQEGT